MRASRSSASGVDLISRNIDRQDRAADFSSCDVPLQTIVFYPSKNTVWLSQESGLFFETANSVHPRTQRTSGRSAMTIHPGRPSISDDELHKRFAPIFETIAAGAVARERSRTLPIEEIRLLKEASFGALRVPIEFGGLGTTLRQTFNLLIELAAADSNLPQAFWHTSTWSRTCS
ncbi:hypothetical protein [Bradyrhizobium sp. JR3.5]